MIKTRAPAKTGARTITASDAKEPHRSSISQVEAAAPLCGHLLSCIGTPMRASRLLQILLILQNHGRQSSRELAEELDVTPRTILRDVEAMTEAGLPIVVHQGRNGGIELGFGYQTRLTGLHVDEAEALGLILAGSNPLIEGLGVEDATRRARRKLIESLPDPVRHRVRETQSRFRQMPGPHPAPDPRIAALADAIRTRRIVRLRARSRAPEEIHPLTLSHGAGGWTVNCARRPERAIPLREWGDLNIEDRNFDPLDGMGERAQTAGHDD
ncbi:MAG: HTH domain-containing protein [Pseudomonadota bacterium]